MTNTGGKPGGLVLAGAVAKGAFAAGVTSELAQRGYLFDRFVGTSAGALNATLLAAGAAAGRPREAAAMLESLWRDRAGILAFVRPTFAISRGLSTTGRVEALARSALQQIVGTTAPKPAMPTKLELITTSVRGAIVDGELTHEDRYEFDEKALLDPGRWSEIAAVAAASAAFPGLFVPPVFADKGQRVDGGTVNNAPISWVMDDEVPDRRIVVVSAEPTRVPDEPPLGGLRLLGRLTEVLINERIGRDLVIAKKRNERRTQLLEALAAEGLSADKAAALADRFGFRKLDLVTIRPEEDLAGGAFLGFLWKPYRERQIAEGKAAAVRALAAASAKRAPARSIRARAPAEA